MTPEKPLGYFQARPGSFSNLHSPYECPIGCALCKDSANAFLDKNTSTRSLAFNSVLTRIFYIQETLMHMTYVGAEMNGLQRKRKVVDDDVPPRMRERVR